MKTGWTRKTVTECRCCGAVGYCMNDAVFKPGNIIFYCVWSKGGETEPCLGAQGSYSTCRGHRSKNDDAWQRLFNTLDELEEMEHNNKTLNEMLDQHRGDIERICTLYRAKDIRLFGSFIHYPDGKHNDIDILVTPPWWIVDHDYFCLRLQRELCKVIDYKVQVVTEFILREQVLKRVLAHTRPLSELRKEGNARLRTDA